MTLKKLGSLLLVLTLATAGMSGCFGLIQTDKGSNNNAAKEVKAQEINIEKELQRKKKVEQTKLEMNKQKVDALKQKIHNYITANNISGTVTVSQNNQFIFNEGNGYANVEKKLPNDPSTTYPIGSITKIFVSTSIMMLQEQHKLSIQDPISKYIPNFPEGNQLLLYHFLTHTSGIQKLHWNRGLNTPQKLVQEIEKAPLKFAPGTKWDYLDANYMVLGYVIEQVSGMPLQDFIQKNIISKVPMKDTGFITTKQPLPYNSVSYLTKDDNKVDITQWLSATSLFACGDIYSTAYDLSQFDYALMGGRLVSQDSLKQVLTPSPHSKYGLGLYYDGDSAYSIGVLGGWYVMHTYYNDKTSIVVCLNARNNSTDLANITNDIYNILKSSVDDGEMPDPSIR
ncbi:serine hydrolase [Neobacillus sp. 114]|uniref:serine hydrolase domain-containing protein n=1 Tax=Neobacillus sp. 114 TaxID=3048535 RepID=UPI0024C2F5F7|nr:serine hydrolase [Neobacillus sp. 114]